MEQAVGRGKTHQHQKVSLPRQVDNMTAGVAAEPFCPACVLAPHDITQRVSARFYSWLPASVRSLLCYL
jgi:hypothetical protein